MHSNAGSLKEQAAHGLKCSAGTDTNWEREKFADELSAKMSPGKLTGKCTGNSPKNMHRGKCPGGIS